MMLGLLAVVGALVAESIALPGGPPAGIDYTAYDPVESRIWIPAGNTGNVDVIRTTRDGHPTLETVGGFATAPPPPNRPGGRRMGPSSVAIAGDLVWIGNRADHRLCAVAARTLRKGPCKTIEPMPDGLAYVPQTGELWVTTPRALGITIVDIKDVDANQKAGPAKPTKPAKANAFIKLDGQPEGYAVDPARGIFYTNLEDRDRTLAIDVKTRQTLGSWSPGCGAEGPRGLALDAARGKLLVACTNGVVALDVGAAAGGGGGGTTGTGRVTGRIATGGGVDNLDYDPRTGLVYVASAADGVLTFARLDATGALAVVGKATTAPGARNAVIDAQGTAYVPDSARGCLIVVRPPPAN
jgi:DNA-binding beta-propeller fold protein YncE